MSGFFHRLYWTIMALNCSSFALGPCLLIEARTSMTRITYKQRFLRSFQFSNKKIDNILHCKLRTLGILKPFRGCRSGLAVSFRQINGKLNIQTSTPIKSSMEFSSFQMQSPETPDQVLSSSHLSHSIEVISRPRVDRSLCARITNSRNLNNLIYSSASVIPPQIDCFPPRNISRHVQCCLLNARSVRNKPMAIKDFVVDHDIDILALTETWLRSGNVDDIEIGTLCPTGYRFLHVPRTYARGGGVGVLFKDMLEINTSLTDNFQSFELMDVRFRSLQCTRILIIYRPPDSSSSTLFFEEFSRLLEQVLAEASSHIMITGDFNFHVEDSNNNYAHRFMDIIESYGMKQHVIGDTHINGHTLDLVITRSDDTIINITKTRDPGISDHYAVYCELFLQKTQFERKVINNRKLRTLNLDSFCNDIVNSSLIQEQSTDLVTLVDQYDGVLRSLLDKHAPLKQRLITIRPAAPWYTPDVAKQKNIRRRLERKWRSSRIQHDRERYLEQCGIVNHLIDSLKSEHYTAIIKEHSSDQKVLFNTVNKLLQKPVVKRYPAASDNNVLANSFADFFTNKIEKIHLSLAERKISETPAFLDSSVSDVRFSDFVEVSEDQMIELASKSSSKSCSLDPMPSTVLKGCFKVLLPTITKIVNLSLSTATMPDALKVAVLSPLLKKPGTDHKQFSNFRPVSNLKLVSKLVEKAAAAQLTSYVMSHHLDEMFQSAYKILHSTETALIKVQNDILRAVDNNKSVILLLLDLSAAFDTVDHSLLLSRLSLRFGIKDKVLAWIKSYLTNRSQFVQIENCKSSHHPLARGVPQGSVLGPLLYVLYTSPIADIIKFHNLQYHLYADDTQLYVSFSTDSTDELSEAKLCMEKCVKDIDSWMVLNGLKLNQDKTELVVISSKYRQWPVLDSVQVGDENICPRPSARNLGVIVDQYMNLDEHVKKVCQTCHYHLHNIGNIRKYLSHDTTEILVHAYITSKLDSCNALLHGLPNYRINRLQSIQNTAARIVTLTKKSDHITPVLCSLHWLPVKFRIIFKMLLLVYKGLHGLAPSYISGLLKYRTYSRSLRSSSQELLDVPRSSLKTYGDRAFSIAAPRLWNELPMELRHSNSLKLFKTNLKTHLFKLAFSV